MSSAAHRGGADRLVSDRLMFVGVWVQIRRLAIRLLVDGAISV